MPRLQAFLRRMLSDFERGRISFYVGQLLGIAARLARSQPERLHLEEIAVALARLGDIQHPALSRLEAERLGHPLGAFELDPEEGGESW